MKRDKIGRDGRVIHIGYKITSTKIITDPRDFGNSNIIWVRNHATNDGTSFLKHFRYRTGIPFKLSVTVYYPLRKNHLT